MLIITSSKFLAQIILAAHYMNMDVHEVDSTEVVNTLDDAENSGARCYCWFGDDKNVPEEANNMMCYKDLCAEEYEFDSLEEGDVVFVYTEVDTDEESTRVAWHMVLFDNIDR